MYSKEVEEDTINVQYKEVWEDTINVQYRTRKSYYKCTVKKYENILWMYSKEVGEDTMNVQ